MKWLRRAIEFALDSLPDILTIIVAGVVVVRHELSPNRPNEINELATSVVALLGLLAVSGLWERHRRLGRIETLARSTNEAVVGHLRSPRAEDFFLPESERVTDESFQSAVRIDICGMTLARTTREFMHVLSKRLEAGATIRLLMIDPLDRSAMAVMARRSMGDTTPEYWATRIKTVIDVVRALVGTTGKTLEVGFLPFLPSFGLTIIDRDEQYASCFVEIYHHRTAEINASFRLNPTRDPYWYAFFVRQWEELWACARVETIGVRATDE